jgi:hypothetical protein
LFFGDGFIHIVQHRFAPFLEVEDGSIQLQL